MIREAFFSQKMFTNELNMALPLQAPAKNTVHGVEIHWLSSKENMPGAAVSKEGHADSFLDH